MSSLKTNTRDAIICSIVWIACVAMLIAIDVVSGWKIMLLALLPLVFFADLVIWLGYSLLELPCGFTEWVCYPFWPFNWDGFHMRIGVIVRIVEIVTIWIVGHWLWAVVKALFQSQLV